MLRLADVKELVKRFDQHYNAARTANSDLHALHRRRTQAYWELGKAASEIKSGLGHGKFLPFLKSRGYVVRTIERAMKIYRAYADRRDECLKLTVKKAEEGGDLRGKQDTSNNRRGQQYRGRGPLRQQAGSAQPAVPDSRNGSRNKDTSASVIGDMNVEHAERLWDLVRESGREDFALSIDERTACDDFLNCFEDQDRAAAVLIHQVWCLLFAGGEQPGSVADVESIRSDTDVPDEEANGAEVA